MATKKRIIPCLDIKGGKVVKGVNFVDLTDVGNPTEIAKRYEAQGADEIIFLDISATNENRDTVYSLVRDVASVLTIPLTVGGGIRTVEDFGKILNCGASKVSINSAAVNNPRLIYDACLAFGKERVVVAVDGKKTRDRYTVFVKGGREDTGIDLAAWAQKCEMLGAGEILLTSMNGDGTKEGYDIPMTKVVCDAVDIPVVASGGCGSIDHIIEVFQKTGCDAALVASLLHYGLATVGDVKSEMKRSGIPCKM